MTRAKILGSLLLAGAMALGPATIVWAQEDGYPPVAPTDDCVQTRESDGEESTVFAPGDEIQVAGAAGCANPDEEGIEGILESTPVRLFVFNARSDGSYVSPVANIPTDVEPGDHRMVVRTQDNEYVQPITIVAAGAPSGLPRTGSQIALLVLWGTLSLVLGSVLVGVTWRRWRESRVAAGVESAWADEASALGVLEAGDTSPYSPTATEWIDPPRSGDATDEPDDVVDGELVGDAQFDEDAARLDETAEFPAPEFAEAEVVQSEAVPEPEEPAEETPEAVLEAFEAEIAEAEPNGAEPNGAVPHTEELHAAGSNGAGTNGSAVDAEPTSDPEEIARRASTKTSEIVDRLRDDLASWKR